MKKTKVKAESKPRQIASRRFRFGEMQLPAHGGATIATQLPMGLTQIHNDGPGPILVTLSRDGEKSAAIGPKHCAWLTNADELKISTNEEAACFLVKFTPIPRQY